MKGAERPKAIKSASIRQPSKSSSKASGDVSDDSKVKVSDSGAVEQSAQNRASGSEKSSNIISKPFKFKMPKNSSSKSNVPVNQGVSYTNDIDDNPDSVLCPPGVVLTTQASDDKNISTIPNEKKNTSSKSVKSVDNNPKKPSPEKKVVVNNEDKKKKIYPPNISFTMTTISRIDELLHQSERNIQRNYLNQLHKAVDLDPVTKENKSSDKKPDIDDKHRPTLATLTRFHRLGRLVGICGEIGRYCLQIGDWLESLTENVPAENPQDSVSKDNDNVKWPPSEVIQLFDVCVENILKNCKEIHSLWNTSSRPTFHTDSRSLERKMNSLHDFLVDILDYLVDLLVELQHGKIAKLLRQAVSTCSTKINALPLAPDKLAQLGMSFPIKYSGTSAVK